jgi:hypothetical protein
MVGIGLLSGWQVHSDKKYEREDWIGLVDYIKRDGNAPNTWFLDPYSLLPFEFYFRGDPEFIISDQPPVCVPSCWYILRQPYTATHAFAQGVTLPNHPWKPVIPPECSLMDEWESPTGLALWKVSCTGN